MMARSQTVWHSSRRWLTFTGRTVAVLLALASGATAQPAGEIPGLGRPPTNSEQRDILIGPDGRELPSGSGTAIVGATVYVQRGCGACHGPTGSEGPAIALVGGEVTTRTNYWPLAHWPFAPSIWDFIHRAMPYNTPGTLTVDEVYSVTAFLLYRNGIIEEEDVMDAESLPTVVMPARAQYVLPTGWTPDTPRGFAIPSRR